MFCSLTHLSKALYQNSLNNTLNCSHSLPLPPSFCHLLSANGVRAQWTSISGQHTVSEGAPLHGRSSPRRPLSPILGLPPPWAVVDSWVLHGSFGSAMTVFGVPLNPAFLFRCLVHFFLPVAMLLSSLPSLPPNTLLAPPPFYKIWVHAGEDCKADDG